MHAEAPALLTDEPRQVPGLEASHALGGARRALGEAEAVVAAYPAPSASGGRDLQGPQSRRDRDLGAGLANTGRPRPWRTRPTA